MTQIITSNSGGGGGGAGAYTYKGTVNTYEDLPSTGLKIGDVYNVINEHTTDPKFPAGANVAWTGTEWDVLGGTFDLSSYQKKLVEGNGIDIDQDTNEISVEDTVINGAAAGATAVQPGDDVSDLNNDAGYITSSDIPTDVSAFNNDAGYITSSDIPTNVSAFNNDAGYLVSSDLEQSDWGQSDNSKIDYIKNKPTIGNATLTIQKNGTNVNTFTANATSNVTANITVPTNTSDLNNDSGFITSSAIPTDVSSFNNDAGYITSSDLPDLSGYQLKSNLVTDLTNPDNTHYPSALAVASAISSAGGGDVTGPASSTDGHLAVFDGATGKIIKDGGAVPTPTTVVDALDSTSTTSALSANQGKVLKGMIDNLAGLGRFLSLWDCTTGQPISFPLATPYTYVTGDWFMVEIVDTTDPVTNYKPTGSSYTGTASTVVESGTVKQGDVYIYDGTNWLLQVNNEPQVSFSDIAGNATDNTSLSNALNAKANDSDVVKLTGNQTIAGTKTFSTSPVVPSKTSDATNTGTAIATEAQVYKKQDTISDLTTIRNGASAGATALQPSAISDTAYGSGWNADTTHAPSKNAVYDKIQSVVSSIPTVNNATLTIQKNNTDVATFTANASSNVTANISVPTDTSDLTNGAGFITGITSGDVTTALGYTPYNSTNPSGYVTSSIINDTAYASSWNGDTTHAPTKNAVYDKISAMDTTISGKQNALTTQTAYTSKGTSTKVPQITTNSLGQVTGITEVDIQAGAYKAGPGIEIKNGPDYSAMQGPAPDGFHVPSKDEWVSVYNIWTALGGGSSDGTNFGIALKLPSAGSRSRANSNVSNQGSYGLYWSSMYYNENGAYRLYFNLYGIYAQDYDSRSNAFSVRCFKDATVIPTSSWTKLYGTSIEAGGIFWNNTDGLISLSSNGTTWITIADKNLGATTVWNSGDTLSEANCGYYYQRGNNYGFPFTGTVTTSSTKVDASNYGPGNYYSSSTFITVSLSPYRWDTTDNGNLWGGTTGVVIYDNAITNTGVLSVNGQTGNVSLYSTTTVTLTSAGWSSNSQTVSVTGVTASNTVIVSPAPSDIADYADCGVYCSAQGSGTLTFGCDTAPDGDIVVNVLIMS